MTLVFASLFLFGSFAPPPPKPAFWKEKAVESPIPPPTWTQPFTHLTFTWFYGIILVQTSLIYIFTYLLLGLGMDFWMHVI